MQNNDLRHKQWEISDSLFSYLMTGGILTGRVNEIIRTCGINADGYSVAKFLERSESMSHSPFLIQRSTDPALPCSGLVYRIRLKHGR